MKRASLDSGDKRRGRRLQPESGLASPLCRRGPDTALAGFSSHRRGTSWTTIFHLLVGCRGGNINSCSCHWHRSASVAVKRKRLITRQSPPRQPCQQGSRAREHLTQRESLPRATCCRVLSGVARRGGEETRGPGERRTAMRQEKKFRGEETATMEVTDDGNDGRKRKPGVGSI
ncbi:hypothetical protein O3P69_018563 [Scylla paramamosain]|uniref:Uncharacterized protein n=1 Tax=Scylla paramamosain TaxID=85552 RepID=A0AAW0T1Y3_SCYPA